MTDAVKLDCPNCGHHIGMVTLPGIPRKHATPNLVERVRPFVEAHLETHLGMERSASQVYETYLDCALSGPHPVTKKAFGAVLRALGYETYRRSDERGYRDVDLRTDHAFHAPGL